MPFLGQSNIRFSGNLPQKNYHFERCEEPAVKEAIKRLCNKEIGYMAVVGQVGSGKSAVIAKTLLADDFLPKECPTVHHVIWMNVLKLSSGNLNSNNFYLSLAKLAGVNVRKPEGQNDPPLEYQLREALQSKRLHAASILLVLDDVVSDNVLPLVAKFRQIVRVIAISKFGATLGVHGANSTYAPDFVNIQPMNDSDSAKMIKELMPDSVDLPPDTITALTKYCSGLPLVVRLICGHFVDCATTETAALTLAQINEKLKPVFKNVHDTPIKSVQNTVSALLSLHFEKDEELFVRFCSFLVFEEETVVDGEDLAFLWNVEVGDANAYCEDTLCAKGILQEISFDSSHTKQLMAQPSIDDERMFAYHRDSIVLYPVKSCFTINSLIYQVTSDLQKRQRQKDNIQTPTIISEAGRKHPRAEPGENILHIAARFKRTVLFRSIIDRSDASSLLKLCMEESNEEKVTPISWLCASVISKWTVDTAPPLVSDASLPLMEKLSATPLTDQMLDQIIAGKGNIGRLLLLSCDSGYPFLAAKLIFKGKANVSACKKRWPYYSALMLTALHGHDDIAKLLVDNGADLAKKDGHGRTALQIAVEKGYEKVVSILLEKGADAVEEGSVMPALITALMKGSEAIAKLLLMKAAGEHVTDDELSERALMLAARACKDPIIVKYLLEQDVDPNSKDILNRSALFQATQEGQVENVKLLLDHGASTELRTKEKYTALIVASLLGHEAIVKMLLEKNANVNARDRIERTALIVASWMGYDSIMKLLLHHGANPNVRDSLGRTPLTLAAERSNEHAVIALVEKGADTTAKDKPYNKTPLMLAAERGNWSIVRYLVEKGASINDSETFHLRTPLMLAAENGHDNVAEFLLQRGSDPNVGNSFNITALMLAAKNGHEKLVKLLLDKNADPKATDNFSRTAAVYAKGHDQIASLLVC